MNNQDGDALALKNSILNKSKLFENMVNLTSNNLSTAQVWITLVEKLSPSEIVELNTWLQMIKRENL